MPESASALGYPPTHEVEVLAETIQMICTISNRTKYRLNLLGYHLDWGKFDDPPNQYPVGEIPSKQSVYPAFRSSGKQGSSSGTEGWVMYGLEGKQSEWIKIEWDVTWAAGASNSVNITTFDPDVAVQMSGFSGHGSVESVTLTVVDGRG